VFVLIVLINKQNPRQAKENPRQASKPIFESSSLEGVEMHGVYAAQQPRDALGTSVLAKAAQHGEPAAAEVFRQR